MTVKFRTPPAIALSAYVSTPNQHLQTPRYEARLAMKAAEAAPLLELADFAWHSRDKRASKLVFDEPIRINSETLPDGRVSLTCTRSYGRGKPQIVDRQGDVIAGPVYFGSIMEVVGDVKPYGNADGYGVAFRIDTVIVHHAAAPQPGLNGAVRPQWQALGYPSEESYEARLRAKAAGWDV